MAPQYQPAGMETKQPLRAPRPEREGSVFVSIFCSMILPGLGQIVVRRFTRGSAILFVFLALLAASIPLTWRSPGIFWYILLPLFLIWLWNMYDAYRCTREYNDQLLEPARADIIQAKAATRLNPLYVKQGTGIPAPPSPSVMAQDPAKSRPAPVRQTGFCPHCGKPVERSGGKFCRHCGKPLQEAV